jgi:hypothetical protein
MNRSFIVILLLICLPAGSQSLSGYYIGKEKIEMSVDFGSSGGIKKIKKWYHLNHLLIQNDTIFLYKEPIRLIHGDTLYSASDGAFYYYSGNLIRKNKSTRARLILTNCDYCIMPVTLDTLTNELENIPTVNSYLIKPRSNKLIINKVKYKTITDKAFPFDKSDIDKFWRKY